ncbi:MAG TPA: hypothetical protein VIJ34_03130 [Acidimicrobiales bacterium]
MSDELPTPAVFVQVRLTRLQSDPPLEAVRSFFAANDRATEAVLNDSGVLVIPPVIDRTRTYLMVGEGGT